MRRSYRTLSAALFCCALLLTWGATSARAAAFLYDQVPRDGGGDGPPPPGDEGDDEEEVLIRARPGAIDEHPSLGSLGLRAAQDAGAAFDWLTRHLEQLGLR